MLVTRYKGVDDFYHGKNECTGILVVNLGTPDQPETGSVRRYLGEFLADPRVVEIPRIFWLALLHGVILRKRAPISAKAYQNIWLPEGSPLMVYSRHISDAIGAAAKRRYKGPVKVELAMRYGKPSIAEGLEKLRQRGVRRLLVLSLYPQYSATTTATVFDAVSKELRGWRWIPETRFINQYHDDSGYIKALANSVEDHWREAGRDGFLLMSFHGLPQRNLQQGDPYFCQCQKTARLLANKLGLAEDKWKISFQSRFGKAQWVQPYTDKTLKKLAAKGQQRVDVICPGFPAACLETLEEMNVENRATFLAAGGEEYHYIPALNQNEDHIGALMDIIDRHIQGWPETGNSWSSSYIEKLAVETQKFAKDKGAKL
jgi:ferrochelatase